MQSYHYQTILIFAINLTVGISAYVINPFVDSIVMSFHMVDSRNETGYYAGMLSAAFMLSRTITSPIWGALVDKIGRKKCVVLNLFAVLITSATFPFVRSYWQAVAIRALLGAFSSAPVACRATATEVCPLDYQPKALMYFSMGFQFGMIAGSCVGGILIAPELQPELLKDYPLALPNLCAAGFSFIVTIFVVLFYKETLEKSKTSSSQSSASAYWSFLKDPFIANLVFIILLNELVQSGVAAVFPSWCWSDVDRGGLMIDQESLGIIVSASSVGQLFLQNFTFKRLLNKTGPTGLTRLSALVSLGAVFLLPVAVMLGDFRVAWMVMSITVINFCSFVTYTCVFLLTNNYVNSSGRGKINALILVFGSSSRCVTPLAAGSLFAWSLSVNTFPINYSLVFYTICMFIAFQIRLSHKVPDEITKEDPLLTQIEISEIKEGTDNKAVS